MGSVARAYNIEDLREMAMKRVPKGLFEFVDRGTEDEVSLRNNRSVFERMRFKPRTLVDVSKRNQEVTLFGKKHKMPITIINTDYLHAPDFQPAAFDSARPGLKLLDTARVVER